MYCDVSGTATTTNDIIVPTMMRVIEAAYFTNYRTSAFSSVQPALNVVGTTVGIFMPAATTGISYTIKLEGR